MATKLRHRWSRVGLVVAASWPVAAQAHVKWFCGEINASLPPQPLREVVTPIFVMALLGFLAFIVIGAVLDALFARFVRTPLLAAERADLPSDIIIRLGICAYALCLWADLALVMWADPTNSAILTPDLYGSDRWVGVLQLAIAAAVLVPRLSLVAATGLAVLYALGIAEVGPVYMIDYLFFPGLAAFVAMGDPRLRGYPRLAAWRVPVLIGSLSFSLMWTAVEKFLFPQWTISVLVLHPGVTAGFPLAVVATIAGFVEFSLAFYLLAGREILGRIGAILLMIVFVAAMPEFGILDLVGHIPVLVILLVALVTGETPLQVSLRRRQSALIGSGLVVAQTYLFTLALLMALYYGLHAASVQL